MPNNDTAQGNIFPLLPVVLRPVIGEELLIGLVGFHSHLIIPLLVLLLVSQPGPSPSKVDFLIPQTVPHWHPGAARMALLKQDSWDR